jgi:hypothetical protein
MNSPRDSLVLNWCSHAAAKYAVEHWHYSRAMPVGKLVKIGVWEESKFKGSIIFGRGANNHIGSPYDLTQMEVAELVRVALQQHAAPVSRIVSIAIKMLREVCPGLRLLVSYADPAQGHIGAIYQAMGWIYTGRSQKQRGLLIAGAVVHKRSGSSKYGTVSGLPTSDILWKYKYIQPLDADMKKQCGLLGQPYPKRMKYPECGHEFTAE